MHPLPLKPPTTRLPSFCVITERWAELPVLYSSFPLANLYMVVNMCKCYCLVSSHSPSRSVPMNPLYICVSIPVLVHRYHFSGFHIYVLRCYLFFNLSYWVHSIGQTLGSSTSSHVTPFCSILWLSIIPLYGKSLATHINPWNIRTFRDYWGIIIKCCMWWWYCGFVF